jgi:hypothetical protein
MSSAGWSGSDCLAKVNYERLARIERSIAELSRLLTDYRSEGQRYTQQVRSELIGDHLHFRSQYTQDYVKLRQELTEAQLGPMKLRAELYQEESARMMWWGKVFCVGLAACILIAFIRI